MYSIHVRKTTYLKEDGSVAVAPRDARIVHAGGELFGAGGAALALCWGALVAGQGERSGRPAHKQNHCVVDVVRPTQKTAESGGQGGGGPV